MQGDFSRVTFEAGKNFSRVLMQQGRVQLDADWNEQTSIMLHHLRTLAADFMGPHGGVGDSFKIVGCAENNSPKDCADMGTPAPLTRDFYILPGHYYVNGILCDNQNRALTYKGQTGYPLPDDLPATGTPNHLVYLDVWERHVTAWEDDDENHVNIREVALKGADTATRAKVVWQVKARLLKDEETKPIDALSDLEAEAEALKAPTEELWQALLETQRLVEIVQILAPEPGEPLVAGLNTRIAALKEIAAKMTRLARSLPARHTLRTSVTELVKEINALKDLTVAAFATQMTALSDNLAELKPKIEQLRLEIEQIRSENEAAKKQAIESLLEDKLTLSRATLRARARTGKTDEDPCLISPEAKFRGAENQLYRVEIHTGSLDQDGNPTTPTFKWSRENGSVIFPVLNISGDTITLAHLGRDLHLGLEPNQWVEVIDDDSVLLGKAGPLLQVKTINREDMSITVEIPKNTSLGNYKESDYTAKHVLLRRWDHRADAAISSGGTVWVTEGTGDTSGWILLEDGVEIQFQKPATDKAEDQNQYRTGDYWLIPARTVTGDVDWPGPKNNPRPQPPQGVEHYYAPLAIITLNNGKMSNVTDCRRVFLP